MKRVVSALVVLSLVISAKLVRGQAVPASPSDTSAVWQTLQHPSFAGGKLATVNNTTLVRDRIRITLTTGTIQFAQPANGVTFAAAFRGSGRLQVTPPNPIETQQLRLFLKQDQMDMNFSDATLSFTDKTFDEIAAQVQMQPATGGGDLEKLFNDRQQQRENAGFGLLPKLLKRIFSADHAQTALFEADLKTSEKGWMNVGEDVMDPEEISVGHYNTAGLGLDLDTWMSFPAGNRTSSEAYADPFAKEDFHIQGYQIDAGVTKGAELAATTNVKLESRLAGERVWIFNLNSNLRVDKVTDEQEKPLEFYQPRERKDDPVSHGEWVAVVFRAPTEKGAPRTLRFHYAGKRVIRQEGPGNYFCPSDGWYPERSNNFASRVDFDITFHNPKSFTLVATGNKTSETTDGNTVITNWKSDIPLAVAGFAYGDYKVITEKATNNVDVDIYANRAPDDLMNTLMQVAPAVGNMSPSVLAKPMATEFANAVRVFENYFGPYPYKHLAVTSLPVSFSYGQGWPGLVYLWSASFLDDQQRHQIGLRDSVGVTDFFRAHETSHMWWGHRVGWKSYHDQWMSEGFAQFSGNLYVQYRENMKEYLKRVRQDKQDLTAPDLHSRHYESIGPVWMGERLSSSESPRAYDVVIYAKGGLILHMLRMMLFDPQNQDLDHRFKDMMRDFTQTYDNKAASTEDFKAIVEKHMTPAMDVERNHRMDWFFRQYVYGTGIPRYEMHYEIQPAGEGQWKVTGEVTRVAVPDGWVDILPIYMHQGQSQTRIGFIRILQQVNKFEIPFKFKPDKISLNDLEDTLADIKQ